MDVYLQFPCLVDWRVQKGEQTLHTIAMSKVHDGQVSSRRDLYLMRDIRPSVTDVPIHLSHDSNVLVAVQQRVLVIFCSSASTARRFICFKAGIRQDDYETLRVLVVGCNGHMLFCYKLRESWRWKRLGSCRDDLHVSHDRVLLEESRRVRVCWLNKHS